MKSNRFGKISGKWGPNSIKVQNGQVYQRERIANTLFQLNTIWLDYKKAFDSVPHEWLIYALKLAKVPPQLGS